MTSLEVLYNKEKKLLPMLWISFDLPAPTHFNDIQQEERAAILAAISDWPSSRWDRFAAQIMWVDNEIGRRVCEDLLAGIREIEESKMNNEVQEQGNGNLPFADREEG